MLLLDWWTLFFFEKWLILAKIMLDFSANIIINIIEFLNNLVYACRLIFCCHLECPNRCWAKSFWLTKTSPYTHHQSIQRFLWKAPKQVSTLRRTKVPAPMKGGNRYLRWCCWRVIFPQAQNNTDTPQQGPKTTRGTFYTIFCFTRKCFFTCWQHLLHRHLNVLFATNFNV